MEAQRAAGGSAHSQWRDHREADRRKARGQWFSVGARTVAAAGLGACLVLAPIGVANWALDPIGEAIPGALGREAAIAAALAGAVLALARAMRPSRETRAWAVGSEGERATASALAALGPEWVVLHDRRLPRSRANVDHVVIGPGGVWVVETKAWVGRLLVGPGPLRRNGRPADRVYDQIWRQVAAVRQAAGPALTGAGIQVRPVVCLHDGRLSYGRDSAGRRVLGPVEFHTPDGLVRRLRLAKAMLSASQVEQFVALIDRGLAPASHGTNPDDGRRPAHPRRPSAARPDRPWPPSISRALPPTKAPPPPTSADPDRR